MKYKKFEVVLNPVVCESHTEYLADSAREVVKFLNEELKASSSP